MTSVKSFPFFNFFFFSFLFFCYAYEIEKLIVFFTEDIFFLTKGEVFSKKGHQIIWLGSWVESINQNSAKKAKNDLTRFHSS